MTKLAVALAAVALGLAAGEAAAQPEAAVRRVDRPTTTISNLVSVPPGYATVFLSGTSAGSGGTPIPDGADTKAQAIIIYGKFKSWLEAEGLSLGDIVMMRVYLVADPTLGRMDTAGANAAYNMFFGTAEQPNKPARITVQAAGLGGRTALVEIEAQAAKKP